MRHTVTSIGRKLFLSGLLLLGLVSCSSNSSTSNFGAGATLGPMMPDAAAAGELFFTVPPAGRTTLPTEYHAYGDSITYGSTLSSPAQAYPYLLGKSLGLQVADYGRNGIETCSILSQFVLGYDGQPTIHKNVLYSLLSGTNDLVINGTGPQEAIFNNCRLAILTWLGIPTEYRAVAGTYAFEGAQGCSAGGLCDRTGTIRVANFATAGAPIYIWYRISDTAAPASSFALSIDGVQQGVYTTRPVGKLPISAKGNDWAIAVIRVSIAAGKHTLLFSTTTGGIAVYAVGTQAPGGSGYRPTILVGDLPTQQKGKELSKLSDQEAFSADIRATVASLASEGFDVRLVPTCRYLLGDVAEFNDALHPNVLGQQHLYQAFADTFSNSSSAVLTASTRGSSTPIKAGDMVNVAPNTTARFTLPPVAPAGKIMTIYNSGRSGSHALIAVSGHDTLQRLESGTAVSSLDLAAGQSATFFPDTANARYVVSVR